MNTMKFNSSDLLSYEEIELLTSSEFATEKANLIASKLKNYLFQRKEGSKIVIYEITKELIYTQCELHSDTVIKTKTTELIEQSIKLLDEKQLKHLQLYKKKFDFIKCNKGVENYLPQLSTYIHRTDIKFNDTPYEMHFKNGFIDFRTLEFKPRELKRHYITKVINRDYVKSTQADIDTILSHIIKIYPNEEDRNYLLQLFGAGLSGVSKTDMTTVFLIGTGDAGKSFTMKLTEATIEEYFTQINDDTFSKNNSKADKVLNTFDNNPQSRIAWINEPSEKGMDTSTFKNFIDGDAKTTKLYLEGSHKISINCKLFFTMNNMPDLDIDTGSKKRIVSHAHTQRFTENVEEVNNENVFLMDRNLLPKLTSKPNLLNAWFDILAQHCNDWCNDKRLPIPQSFKNAKNDIVNCNNVYGDFIEEHIMITDDVNDRIHKSTMYDLFRAYKPENKYIKDQTILSKLKDASLRYDSNMRTAGFKTQGSYYACRLKDFADDDDAEAEMKHLEFNHAKTDYKSKYDEALEKIKMLEEYIKLNQSLQQSQSNIQEIEKEINEPSELDNELQELEKVITSDSEITSLDDLKAMDAKIKKQQRSRYNNKINIK